ncbi:L,D-transpeptidase [Enterovirga sp.]|jgi:lipoprotein-anchoring transpeptidase ErfK/SrfK|uniref:L,D-transpeptidase n=1 Tax=Enterovirga sp. TaxID=2026350 RepID=UPI00262236B6|nr:L,D-transpeptidase [Enterovirga sp.]MDB5593029.1 erfK [Enterovirga sp.]
MRRSGLGVFAAAALMVGALGSAEARQAVRFDAGVEPGTIVVKSSERKLYLVTGYGSAIQYPVAVGRPGKQWSGEAAVQGKYVSPAWSPPDEVRRDNPRLPNVIPGGSRGNPMGTRALVLDRGQYAIHGTNAPGSIGTFASYGCIRMHNADINDLFERVDVGTRVVVLR